MKSDFSNVTQTYKHAIRIPGVKTNPLIMKFGIVRAGLPIFGTWTLASIQV